MLLLYRTCYWFFSLSLPPHNLPLVFEQCEFFLGQVFAGCWRGFLWHRAGGGFFLQLSGCPQCSPSLIHPAPNYSMSVLFLTLLHPLLILPSPTHTPHHHCSPQWIIVLSLRSFTYFEDLCSVGLSINYDFEHPDSVSLHMDSWLLVQTSTLPCTLWFGVADAFLLVIDNGSYLSCFQSPYFLRKKSRISTPFSSTIKRTHTHTIHLGASTNIHTVPISGTQLVPTRGGFFSCTDHRKPWAIQKAVRTQNFSII